MFVEIKKRVFFFVYIQIILLYMMMDSVSTLAPMVL